MKLPYAFYRRSDVCLIAKELLGKYLFVRKGGEICGGRIVETEAYAGRNDRGCHAYNGKRTLRTAPFYEAGGIAYVYLCYGVHHLFNVITNVEDKADAVLIRGLEPTLGIDFMLQRRGMTQLKTRLTAGPGALSKALGISISEHNTLDLMGDEIWLEDRGEQILEEQIIVGPRVGLASAGPDALLPWRYSIKDNRWVSPAKPKYEK